LSDGRDFSPEQRKKLDGSNFCHTILDFSIYLIVLINYHQNMVPKSDLPEANFRKKVVPHDPKLADLVSQVDYEMAAAIAELLDNSIDAGAKNLLIRFVRTKGRLKEILVIDDGKGIDEKDFDKAMTYARQREYESNDTGMFGIGLKSSSLAIADELYVYSHVPRKNSSGRCWTKESAKKQELYIIPSDQADEMFQAINPSLPWENYKSGTIVRWVKVKDFERIVDSAEFDAYASREMIKIENRIGLLFHRLLESEGRSLQIYLDIQDQETGQIFAQRTIKPINPFKYPKTGCKGYPKKFVIKVGNRKTVEAIAHIWPKGMKSKEFKIPRDNHAGAAESQGLYIYRNDRLLVAGGWKGLKNPEAHQSLARMEINIDSSVTDSVEVSFNKANVNFPGSVATAIKNSSSRDGTSFDQWISKAEEVNRTQIKTEPKINLPRPKKGLPAAVQKSFSKESQTGDDVHIEWKKLNPDVVFKLSSQQEKLYVNSLYKNQLSTGIATDKNATCVPLTLLLIAINDLIGKRQTPKVKALNTAIQKVLLVSILESQ
jgi:anti-sigma regulatory factor (Ser/Thr protein kinase)